SVSGVAAAASKARVVNLSLGSSGSCSATMQSALDQARSLGATVVAAAGNNSGATAKYSPANCRNLIVVTALSREGKRASYANFGAEVDVAAPGGDMATGSANGVLSTSNTGMLTVGSDSYRVEQGTSMATPHVAGVAALMLARNPALTPDEVEVLIKSSTRKIPGACTSCGTGLVDAAAAVNAVFLAGSAPTLVTEVEPNNSHAQAQLLSSFPAKVKGSINANGDLDTYRISVPAKGTVKARLIGNAESDYNLAFRNTKSVVLATSVRAKGLTDELSWTNSASTAADLFVRVSRASGGVGDSGGRYTLEVTR
ncbi:S8 family serine peptidase, partial [Ideonella azotifigens]